MCHMGQPGNVGQTAGRFPLIDRSFFVLFLIFLFASSVRLARPSPFPPGLASSCFPSTPGKRIPKAMGRRGPLHLSKVGILFVGTYMSRRPDRYPRFKS